VIIVRNYGIHIKITILSFCGTKTAFSTASSGKEGPRFVWGISQSSFISGWTPALWA